MTDLGESTPPPKYTQELAEGVCVTKEQLSIVRSLAKEASNYGSFQLGSEVFKTLLRIHLDNKRADAYEKMKHLTRVYYQDQQAAQSFTQQAMYNKSSLGGQTKAAISPPLEIPGMKELMASLEGSQV